MPRKSKRVEITHEQLIDALADLRTKLMFRMAQKGRGTFASRHEILGIIDEEKLELTEAVKSKTLPSIKEELLDIAVGAVFGVACINQGTLDW
jgi:NTP pyrophosphatase (non-canonical NTP hydrolase)